MTTLGARMQIKELLQGVKSAPLVYTTGYELEAILSHVLQLPRSYFYSHPDACVSEEDKTLFYELLRRREEGEPLAYILGKCDFWSLTLAIDATVLIPRPETELLLDIALRHLDRRKALVVAELGTGSGALALAIAKDCPHWHICATDICEGALQVAERNAKTLSIPNVSFHLGNWLYALENRELVYSRVNVPVNGHKPPSPAKQHQPPGYHFSAIISNPPYVATNDPDLQESVQRYEPSRALFAGDDGLDAIREIIKQAPGKLNDNGWLMFEHGFNQAVRVRSLLHEQGFCNIATYKDLAGHDRVTIGRKEAPSSNHLGNK